MLEKPVIVRVMPVFMQLEFNHNIWKPDTITTLVVLTVCCVSRKPAYAYAKIVTLTIQKEPFGEDVANVFATKE